MRAREFRCRRPRRWPHRRVGGAARPACRQMRSRPPSPRNARCPRLVTVAELPASPAWIRAATCCGFISAPQMQLVYKKAASGPIGATGRGRGIIPTMDSALTDENLVDVARQALNVEIDGLRAQLPRLGADFARACRICLDCQGASWSPAWANRATSPARSPRRSRAPARRPFSCIRRGEPRRRRHDHARRRGARAVQLRRNRRDPDASCPRSSASACRSSPLPAIPARRSRALATVHLDIGVPAEACPLNFAPTASTTAALGCRRCARRRAAQGARLHRGGFRALPPGRSSSADGCCCTSRTSCAPARTCRKCAPRHAACRGLDGSDRARASA